MNTRRLNSAVSVFLVVIVASVLALAQAGKEMKAGGEMKAKPKAGHKARHSAAMKGVPSGVGSCLDHLIKMAAADPLIPYEGHPSEIINNGLLWNNPDSKCSVGADQRLRDKVGAVALAWNLKDAAKVRSLLEEVKAAAGSLITEKPKTRKHKRASTKTSTATKTDKAAAK